MYEIAIAPGRAARQRFVSAVAALAAVPDAHLLPIERFTIGPGGGLGYIVTPYPGNSDGLVTLATLREQNGGRMDPTEVERAIQQTLSAAARANESGLVHGLIDPADILVDRSGQVLIELYGLTTRLADTPAPASTELRREELRSIAKLAYVLLCGIEPSEPRIPASRLSKRVERAWDAWLDEGLDASGGFESAADSMSKLPSARMDEPPTLRPAVVGTMLRRFRSALTSGRDAADR